MPGPMIFVRSMLLASTRLVCIHIPCLHPHSSTCPQWYLLASQEHTHDATAAPPPCGSTSKTVKPSFCQNCLLRNLRSDGGDLMLHQSDLRMPSGCIVSRLAQLGLRHRDSNLSDGLCSQESLKLLRSVPFPLYHQ